jgi:predicted DNA-binding protein (MmcQ/YjbR family)
MPARQPLSKLRKLCLALPEAHEVIAWGAPTFRVKNKLFAMYASPSNHHGGGRPAVWLKAPPGEQEWRVRGSPECFFVPPYVGPSGWVGAWLDDVADWHELADMLRAAYCLTAPAKLAALVQAPAE